MERTLFAFIWKYSKRQQFVLLAMTLITFPFLYATLELPKRIINDAIGAPSEIVMVYGVELTQTRFLVVLCLAYLVAVIIHGMLKMRLNTMKGVLAERMLRRFRYTLIERMMRFPRRYFENTSQGELVSMVTSEAEPMGGLMGDAVAQPVFQAGQMIIIVVFLFLQSVWFGLAGIALIPLQAWLIPMLQRRINLMNKERIGEIRQFAAEIGETAAGVTDLRTNGGRRFRLAMFTDRLGRLFDVRFRIYQTKFFMKFLNNFITQLTPFFFYLVGGILAIRGEITVGALVAALAAYKDLSSPWKELLTYYNQTQDMSLRWEIVTERFAPQGMLDAKLFEGAPADIPHLAGPIQIDNVTVREPSGNPVLQDITLDIPQGAQVAIKASAPSERRALAELLTREITPARGRVTVAGHDLSSLHQAVIAARIGYAERKNYVFSGSIGDNVLMPLRTSPKTVLWDPEKRDSRGIEARRAGNSPDSLEADWLDPALAGLTNGEDVEKWWFALVKAIGADDAILRRMLSSLLDPAENPDLAARIVGLREEVFDRLKAKGVEHVVHRFDPDTFNPTVPLGGNLLFAAPRVNITQEGFAREKAFLSIISEDGLAEQAIAISQTIVETLLETFGMDGTNHPLFTALGIEEALYERLVEIAIRRRDKGDGALTSDEFSLLLTVPFTLTAEQIGSAFPDSFKEEILAVRRSRGERLRAAADDLFVHVTPNTYLPRLTILENLLYGRVSMLAGVQEDVVKDLVLDVLREHGLERSVAANLFAVETNIGGTNLPPSFHERLAFNRAGIKRPDILILNQTLPSFGAASRTSVRARLRDLLPKTTQIFIDDSFANPDSFDLFIEITEGRIGGVEESDALLARRDGSSDLRAKLKVLQRNDLFGSLDARSQRLLAFASRWYEAPAGTRIFSVGEAVDGAYLCLQGEAALTYPAPGGQDFHVSTVSPGRLIGDLAVILDEPRQLDLTTTEDSVFLRLGAEQFRSVIESDPGVQGSLLIAVARNLNQAADTIRDAKLELAVRDNPALKDALERPK